MTVDFDRVLKKIGGFGRYQIKRFILYNIAIAVLFPYTLYNLIFITYTPSFYCATYIDGDTHENVNQTFSDGLEPGSIDILRIRFGWIRVGLGSEQQKAGCSVYVNQSGELEEYKCSSWTFNQSEGYETLVTDWNLVCDDAWWVTLIQTVSNVSIAFGALIFAVIIDTYGRKAAFFISVTVCVFSGVALPFSPSKVIFLIIRTIQASMALYGWVIPYITCIEMVGPKNRSFITAVMISVFALGATSIALLAWLCTHWFTLALVTSVPFFGFYLYWPLLDESPRWLLAKGNMKELNRVCEKIARVNGVQLRPGELDGLLVTAQNELKRSQSNLKKEGAKGKTTIVDLFKTQGICLKTLLLLLLYVANALVYTGLAFDVDNLEGNRFLSFAILMLIEVPAGIAVVFILNRFGRIIPMSITMVVGGLAAIAVAQIPVAMLYVILAMAAICKLGISTSFAALSTLASETFPTPLRGSGAGLGGFLGNMSTVAIPFIIASAKAMKSLPMVVMGLVSVIGGIIVLFLPETFNMPLPETVFDSNVRPAGFATFWQNVSLKALKDGRRRSRQMSVVLQDINNQEAAMDELRNLSEKYFEEPI